MALPTVEYIVEHTLIALAQKAVSARIIVGDKFQDVRFDGQNLREAYALHTTRDPDQFLHYFIQTVDDMFSRSRYNRGISSAHILATNPIPNSSDPNVYFNTDSRSERYDERLAKRLSAADQDAYLGLQSIRTVDFPGSRGNQRYREFLLSFEPGHPMRLVATDSNPVQHAGRLNSLNILERKR